MHDHLHDCSKVIAKVGLTLDGELNPDEEKEFLKEINDCPKCLEKFNIEKSFKEFLTQKVERKTVSSVLVKSIKDKIKTLVLED